MGRLLHNERDFANILLDFLDLERGCAKPLEHKNSKLIRKLLQLNPDLHSQQL